MNKNNNGHDTFVASYRPNKSVIKRFSEIGFGVKTESAFFIGGEKEYKIPEVIEMSLKEKSEFIMNEDFHDFSDMKIRDIIGHGFEPMSLCEDDELSGNKNDLGELEFYDLNSSEIKSIYDNLVSDEDRIKIVEFIQNNMDKFDKSPSDELSGFNIDFIVETEVNKLRDLKEYP